MNDEVIEKICSNSIYKLENRYATNSKNREINNLVCNSQIFSGVNTILIGLQGLLIQ